MLFPLPEKATSLDKKPRGYSRYKKKQQRAAGMLGRLNLLGFKAGYGGWICGVSFEPTGGVWRRVSS